MEILNLKTFQALIEQGGIKGASKQLNTVPSNISSRIQKLEDELDAKLFRLVGRKLELTPTGRLLSEYAAKILELEYQAKTAIQNSKGSYELRIGAPETFTAIHLPAALKQLKAHSPNIRPKIVTATSSDLVRAVLENKVDCAVVGNAREHELLTIMPIVEEELVLVEPLDGTADSVLFVRDEGCGYRQRAVIWQQSAGRSNEEIMVMSSAEGILGCIAAGLGYTIVGKDLVTGSRYERALSISPIARELQTLKLSVVYQKEHPLSEGIGSFVRMFSSR